MPRREPPLTDFDWIAHGYCRNVDCPVRWMHWRVDPEFRRSQFKCYVCGRRLAHVRFEPCFFTMNFAVSDRNDPPDDQLEWQALRPNAIEVRTANGRAKRIALDHTGCYTPPLRVRKSAQAAKASLTRESHGIQDR